MGNCIICGGKIIMQCKCMRGDKACENGHSFHWSPFYNEYHEGMSNHSKPDEECCEEKIKIGE